MNTTLIANIALAFTVLEFILHLSCMFNNIALIKGPFSKENNHVIST